MVVKRSQNTSKFKKHQFDGTFKTRAANSDSTTKLMLKIWDISGKPDETKAHFNDFALQVEIKIFAFMYHYGVNVNNSVIAGELQH